MTDKTSESARGATGTASRALLAILGFWALAFGCAGYLTGAVEGVNAEGAQWALAVTAVLMLAVLLGTLVATGPSLAAILRTLSLCAMLFLAVATLWAVWREVPLGAVLTSGPALGILAGGVFAVVFLMVRQAGATLPRSILAAVVTLTVFGAGLIPLKPAPLLIAAAGSSPPASAAPVEPREYALSQPLLLDAQIAGLADGRNGKPEMFGLFVAAYAGQSVFLSEVEGARAILDAQYRIAPRSLILGNSLRAPLRYPEADWANLDRALAALAGRMGEEDVLFLFLTSHGNTDALSLTFHPAAGRTEGLILDAVGLADLLDQHVTTPLVTVISACRSGSFIDDLADEDRLIITASAANRASFGCRDGADWTYFGREFFDAALRQEPDPRKAFAAALPLVEAAEAKLDWARPSQPQISEGASVGAALDRVLMARVAAPQPD